MAQIAQRTAIEINWNSLQQDFWIAVVTTGTYWIANFIKFPYSGAQENKRNWTCASEGPRVKQLHVPIRDHIHKIQWLDSA